MSSTVRIDWGREFDNAQMWNKVCTWAIERYGLPGDRFQSHANVNYMEFVFKSDKDALMMSLMWNAPIIPDNELTVEHIGKMLG